MFNKYVFNGKYKNRPFFCRKIAYDKPDIPPWFSVNMADFVSRLLDKDPSTRLGCGVRGAQSIKAHPLFTVSSFPISVII
jgi:serine/threonine protein kinase